MTMPQARLRHSEHPEPILGSNNFTLSVCCVFVCGYSDATSTLGVP